jgi:hypothetical protein
MYKTTASVTEEYVMLQDLFEVLLSALCPELKEE